MSEARSKSYGLIRKATKSHRKYFDSADWAINPVCDASPENPLPAKDHFASSPSHTTLTRFEDVAGSAPARPTYL